MTFDSNEMISVFMNLSILCRSEMSEYSCVLCQTKGTFSEVIEHSVASHPYSTLKYNRHLLDDSTGRWLRQTINFSIVPSELSDHVIVPLEETDDIELQDIAKSSEPCRGNDANSGLPVQFDNNTADSDDDDGIFKSLEGNFIAQTPEVLRILESHNKLRPICNLWNLISAGAFPLNNICFELFIDVDFPRFDLAN